MRALLFVTLMSMCALSLAQSEVRRVSLGAHGELVLELPAAWKHEMEDTQEGLPTLRLTPSSGAPFEILVTPMQSGLDEPSARSAAMREFVESAATDAQAQAVEERLEVRELKAASGTGYYFAATDRAPKPGEYKYMTQGMIPVGELVVGFTILTNDGQASVVEDAMASIKRAFHRGAHAA
jgi:hypothetical protein